MKGSMLSSTGPRALVGRVLPGVPVATGDMLGSVGAGLALEARRRFA